MLRVAVARTSADSITLFSGFVDNAMFSHIVHTGGEVYYLRLPCYF